jgi:hypothetical protein
LGASFALRLATLPEETARRCLNTLFCKQNLLDVVLLSNGPYGILRLSSLRNYDEGKFLIFLVVINSFFSTSVCSTEPEHTKPVLVFDFDGVIAEADNECPKASGKNRSRYRSISILQSDCPFM